MPICWNPLKKRDRYALLILYRILATASFAHALKDARFVCTANGRRRPGLLTGCPLKFGSWKTASWSHNKTPVNCGAVLKGWAWRISTNGKWRRGYKPFRGRWMVSGIFRWSNVADNWTIPVISRDIQQVIIDPGLSISLQEVIYITIDLYSPNQNSRASRFIPSPPIQKSTG